MVGNWVTSGGAFNPRWYNYNCYAFAINRAEQPQFYPSRPYIQYQPGDMSGAGAFQNCSNINQLAEIIRADLVAMGFSNISLSSSIPTINSTQELICVRMKYDVDYHFMRYDLDTNAWYHKPGTTAVLKYNYSPNNNMLWYNEYSNAQGTYPSTFEYNSDIVFITYSKNQINVAGSATSRKYIQPNKDVFCELDFTNTGNYDIQLRSTHSFHYEIYDKDFNVVLSGTGTAIDEYFPAVKEKYYLRANFETNTSLHYIDISIENHVHSNYSFEYKDSSFHIGTCVCGHTITERHWVKQTSGRYANCVDCGALIDLGGTITPINPFNIAKVSVNGSYILANGIVVVVEVDVEAYINGTLIFYEPDKLPVTQ